MALMQHDWCPHKEEMRTQAHTEWRPCEDTGEDTHVQAMEGRKPQEGPTLQTLCSWASSCQDCEKT